MLVKLVTIFLVFRHFLHPDEAHVILEKNIEESAAAALTACAMADSLSL